MNVDRLSEASNMFLEAQRAWSKPGTHRWVVLDFEWERKRRITEAGITILAVKDGQVTSFERIYFLVEEMRTVSLPDWTVDNRNVSLSLSFSLHAVEI